MEGDHKYHKICGLRSRLVLVGSGVWGVGCVADAVCFRPLSLGAAMLNGPKIKSHPIPMKFGDIFESVFTKT